MIVFKIVLIVVAVIPIAVLGKSLLMNLIDDIIAGRKGDSK